MRDGQREGAHLSEVTASSSPCIIHDAFVSPGCTRADITMTFFAATSEGVAVKSVTESRSHTLPPNEWQSTSRRMSAARFS